MVWGKPSQSDDAFSGGTKQEGIKYLAVSFIFKTLVVFKKTYHYFYFMYVCLHVCLCTTFAWCLQRPEENTRFPGTGVTNG